MNKSTTEEVHILEADKNSTSKFKQIAKWNRRGKKNPPDAKKCKAFIGKYAENLASELGTERWFRRRAGEDGSACVEAEGVIDRRHNGEDWTTEQ